MSKAAAGVAGQRKILEAEGFSEDKVGFAVLETERRKLRDLEAERGNYERSIAQFEGLRVSDDEDGGKA